MIMSQRHAKSVYADRVGDRALEWFSALVMVAWSVLLAFSGGSLSLPSFGGFHRFGMTETLWAWGFGSIGMARLVALYINGRWPKTPHVRMVGAMLGVVAWGQVAFMLTEGSLAAYGKVPTGAGTYGLLALADLFSIYRAAFDARYHA
jgi:hypothetical protein